MLENALIYGTTMVAGLYFAYRLYHRLQLSLAKHPSLAGHAKLSRRAARLLPHYSLDIDNMFACDGAPVDIVNQRRDAFLSLAAALREKSPRGIEMTAQLAPGVSDVQFTSLYRVPFQFASVVREHLKLGSFVEESRGVMVKDVDGNWSYDLAGSYGVNLFGYDFYKECMAGAAERTRALGPVLGAYHPLILENVRRLIDISGQDEVSFHMSGTEAVMQAVRLARYHTRRSHIVTFTGAYHGWWDGVQPGVGNSRRTNDVYMLKELDSMTLRVLRNRNDIACVLINPIQAMHPNRTAPGDSTLISNGRKAGYDKLAYSRWLQSLREVCDEKGIVMIIDEVFVGFRLAYRGAQEYFNVRADMVTYGKTLGGGYPVGVVCGRADLMKRYSETHPADISFARGTFNSHPMIIAAMYELLTRIEAPTYQAQYQDIDTVWDQRAATVNQDFTAASLPLRIVNMGSIWTVIYTQPSRFNWLYQYYLRAAGLAVSWVGSGRFIFSHNYTEADFQAVRERLVSAAQRMNADGWWWPGATDLGIKLRVVRELLSRQGGVQPTSPATDAPLPQALP